MKNIVIIIFTLFLLISCSTSQKAIEVPVETIKTEYIHDIKIDSVYIKDSIDRYVKGDTVYIHKEHTKYQYIKYTDTILRIDTIPKVITVEVVKEVNHIKWYQKALMWVGGLVTLVLTGCLIYKIKF